MAMLAEKRTKTRYYLHNKALNPRGNAWCEDSSKFGQRMLEKMGWSQGKGLGVKEDGSTDPVTVSYKWDSKGMGYKGADGDEAVAQQKDFDALLATLSQDSSTDSKPTATPEKSPKSLELMSQKSRARVHYHKFTRGKDLSRASSKDLASILGMATEIKSSAPASPGPIVKPDVGPPIEQNMVTTFGITTIARGNINEYFKQKYDEKKRKLAGSVSDDGVKISTISDDAAHATEVEEHLDNSFQPDNSTKKKKKKKKNKTENENEVDVNCSTVVDDTFQDDSNLSTSKSRRKSVTWGDVEVSFVSKYIKDMADTSSDSINGELDTLVSSVEVNDKSNCNKKKKKKKDKKRTKELASEMLEQNSEDTEAKEDAETIRKKKKKKDKQSAGCTDEGTNSGNTASEDINSLEGSLNTVTEDSPIKKKKKKSSDGVERVGSSEASFESVQAEITNEISLKKQKKKKVKDLSEDVSPESCAVTDDSSEKKKKKVKKSISSETIGYDTVEESSKKRKKCDETVLDGSVNRNPQSEECLERKKKKRKKETLESNSFQDIQFELGDDKMPTDTNVRKKKKKNKSINADSDIALDDNSEVGNETAPNSDEQPALSTLTQERIAKWKDRRKSKDEKNCTEESRINEKSQTAKIEYNPNQPTQDYNHRKVLSTLGYNVKEATSKTITVKMPASNFSGSNLDSIPGYGQSIKSC